MFVNVCIHAEDNLTDPSGQNEDSSFSHFLDPVTILKNSYKKRFDHND